MKQRSSAPARVLATTALVAGVVVLIAIVAGSLGGGDDDSRSNGKAAPGKAAQGKGNGEEPPKSYVVQNGDTLTSIANETGVSVDRIEELNPGVDPQILVSGEKLKLR